MSDVRSRELSTTTSNIACMRIGITAAFVIHLAAAYTKSAGVFLFVCFSFVFRFFFFSLFFLCFLISAVFESCIFNYVSYLRFH